MNGAGISKFAQVLSSVFMLYVVYHQLAVTRLFIRTHCDPCTPWIHLITVEQTYRS